MATELDLNEEDGGSVWDEAGRQVPGDLASKPLQGHRSHFLLGKAWWWCSHVGLLPVLES